MRNTLLALLLLTPMTAGIAQGQENRYSFGGDEYAGGDQAAISTAVTHDAFAAGFNATLQGAVAGDAHVAGFNVTSSGQVSGDLYAVGFSVTVSAPVGSDATLAGNSVIVLPDAAIGGNVRLAGQNVTISAPIGGSALITARSLTLNAPITGDLHFVGETLTFGDRASVAGSVLLRAPAEIAVPESVAAAERVRFELLEPSDFTQEAARTAETALRGVWPSIWLAVSGLVVLLVIGGIFIALMPATLLRLQRVSGRRPLGSLLMGALALGAVLGLVPVIAMTLLGVLLVPVALAFVAVSWILGYLAGVYLLTTRIASAFIAVDTNLKRVAALAAGLVVMALLNAIPLVGWLINLIILFFGLGAIAILIVIRLAARWPASDLEERGATDLESAGAE